MSQTLAFSIIIP